MLAGGQSGVVDQIEVFACRNLDRSGERHAVEVAGLDVGAKHLFAGKAVALGVEHLEAQRVDGLAHPKLNRLQLVACVGGEFGSLELGAVEHLHVFVEAHQIGGLAIVLEFGCTCAPREVELLGGVVEV